MRKLLAAGYLPRALPDIGLLVTLLAILAIGLIMVASSSVAVADHLFGDPMHYFYHQLVYAVIGLAVAYAVVHVPMRRLEKHSFAMLGLGLFLLVVVLIPGLGHSVNGAQRWLSAGSLSFQASEPARLCLIVYIAGYASRRQVALSTSMGGLLRPFLFMAIACFLMLLEPDLGAGVILMAVSGIILFVAGARLFNIALLAAAGLLAGAAAIFSSPYRMERLLNFADPWAHPYDSGFQLVQSLIAIGRGHIWGVGLGESMQKMSYLPETHTDFLFAIYAEEFGLLGTLLLIALFSIVLWRGFKVARRAVAEGRLFGGLLAYGLTSWLVLQAFINIAVNMGLVPTKGLTLPLMSYGGSSLVMMCALCALLIRVDLESAHAREEEQ